ncbi:DUF1389 domain-containing protein [Chlamydia vaughanii]|uniref:DUF1389 domain-containing protein n=1 Tax=Chlamydia vaughanii TaxID=3112552 RepID=UPI0032B2E969
MSGIVLHSLLKNDCRCHASYPFEKRTQDRVIAALVMTALAILSALISIIPAIILGVSTSFILSGIFGTIAIALLIIAVLAHYTRSNFSKGLREILGDNYPPVLCNLIDKKHLTIGETRLLINALEENADCDALYFLKYVDTFPRKLRIAVTKFGISKLLDNLEAQQLKSLDSILLQHCPLYWLREFINIAPRPPLEYRRNLTPEEKAAYWLGRAGCGKNTDSIFVSHTHLIATQISKEDFALLAWHCQNEDWHNSALKPIKRQLCEACREHAQQKLPENESIDAEAFSKDIDKYLLQLCVHGVSWEQLCLIQAMNSGFWDRLCAFDGNRQKLRMFAVPCLNEISDENHHLYEPLISLTSWKDFDRLGLTQEALENREISNPDKRIIKYFLRQARYHPVLDTLHEEAINRLPQYTIDFTTGAKLE